MLKLFLHISRFYSFVKKEDRLLTPLMKYIDGQLIDNEKKNLRPLRCWDRGNWPHRQTRSYWACPNFQLTPFPFPARYASPFLCSRWILRRRRRGWQKEEEGTPGEKRKVFIATSESVLTSLGKRWRWRSGKERVQVGEQGKVVWRGSGWVELAGGWRVMGFSRVVLAGICIQSICHQPLSPAQAILDLEYLLARIYGDNGDHSYGKSYEGEGWGIVPVIRRRASELS